MLWAEAAHTQGIGEEFRAIAVSKGSVAEQAGIKEGDTLLTVDGWSPPTGPESVQALASEITKKLKSGKPLTIAGKRGSEPLQFTVTPESVCSYQVALADETAINAMADGKRVLVTRGMMRFATTDTELALAVSHEISHNAMGHITAQMGNRMIGAVLEAILAAATRTRSGEIGVKAAFLFRSNDCSTSSPQGSDRSATVAAGETGHAWSQGEAA